MDMNLLTKIVLETDKLFFDEKLRGDVKKKGVADYVTRADIEISKYLQRRLAEEFPEIGFMSEEGDKTLEENKDYWILDPIDGTTNFMHGLAFCGLSLALYSEGEVAAGVVYVPYAKELFFAQKGKGAYLNGERVYVSEKTCLCDSVGIIEYNPYFKDEHEEAFSQALKIYRACQDLRTFGSAAVELCQVACGRADAFLGRYLKPWDYAAGLIIVQEAGGIVTNIDRKIDIPQFNQHIVAANSFVYEEFMDLLSD